MILTREERRRVRAVRLRLAESALFRHGLEFEYRDRVIPTVGNFGYRVNLNHRHIGFVLLAQEDSLWWPVGVGGTAFINPQAYRRGYDTAIRAALTFVPVQLLYRQIFHEAC